MIDRAALLKDLRPLATALVDDLRTRLSEHKPSAALVERDYQQALAAKRTAQT